MENQLFINIRYIEGNYPYYVNHNGIFKKITYNFLTKRLLNKDNLWYCLNDLPPHLQEEFKHFAISQREYIDQKTNENKRNDVRDSESVLIYVNKNTELLPIVGNLLPEDGIEAYTVIEKDDKLLLKPILVCWNCHWSELFAGITSYGNNVFCLASDLTKEQRENFKNDIIKLQEVPVFLEENKTKLL